MLTDRHKQFRPPEAIQADLERLIRERGLEKYGTFFVSGEGKLLPDGSESGSGYVIDDSERVFWFWLDWDCEHQALSFTQWEQVVGEETVWGDDPEYLRARKAAGLPSG